jgi:hypothetical protein
MNGQEIIEMARQAGLHLYVNDITEKPYAKILEDFAKLVAAKEREACAKVCENDVGEGPDNGCCPTYWNEAAECCAKAIRART